MTDLVQWLGEQDAIAAAATPGRRHWAGHTGGSPGQAPVELRASRGDGLGATTILTAWRYGMQGAQLVFIDADERFFLKPSLDYAVIPNPNHPWEVRGCTHPDAVFIAAVDPEQYRLLLALVKEVNEHQPYTTVGVEPGTVVCLACSDLEDGSIVLYYHCPYRPVLDALRQHVAGGAR